MTPNPCVKLRTTYEERVRLLVHDRPSESFVMSVALAADVETLLAENTRLRALLVAEKRAHMDSVLASHGRVMRFADADELRASADAIERGEG